MATLYSFDNTWAAVAAAIIVGSYSSFGGVKAVTLTDVVQFFTFSTIIPILALVIWNHFKCVDKLTYVLEHDPNFDLRQVVGWTPQFGATLSLFCYFAIPGFYTPELFQRIAMAQNVKQVKYSLTYAAGIFLIVVLLLSLTGFLLLADNPGLKPGQLVPHMINKYTYVGFRGCLCICVTALSMSTADSCLNTCSVLFANDIVKPLTNQKVGSVWVARLFSVLVGLGAM